MRINGCTSYKTRFPGGRGEIDRAAKELQCRQLYGDTRGIHYEKETVVMRSSRTGMGNCKAGGDDAQESRMSNAIKSSLPTNQVSTQTTFGFSNGKKASTKGKSPGSNGFFNRIISEMDSRDKGPKSSQTGKWTRGVSETVPAEKKASIERSLNWLECKMDGGNGKTKQEVKPPSSDVMESIMTRIKNLMMHDLPYETTQELRLLAREIERLNAQPA